MSHAPRPHLTRRTFIQALGGVFGGLALGLGSGGRAEAASPEADAAFDPNVFIHLEPSGLLSIVCHRSEMGQGIRSSIPMAIADELGADWEQVRVLQADGDPKYGNQNTDGSRSIRNNIVRLRQLGATARAMLITAAARRWEISPEGLTTRDHHVVEIRGQRRLSFGDLAAEAGALPVPDAKDAPLRPDGELRWIGTAFPLIDGPAYVTGQAQYGADVTLPGMRVAVVIRPPVVGGRVVSIDAAQAKSLPGVRAIVRLPDWTPPGAFQPLGGVAIVADHTWAAMEGRRLVKVEWDHGPNAAFDAQAYDAALREAVDVPGEIARKTGDAEAALKGALQVLDARYDVPFLAHAPMEPPAALAWVDGARCEVWASTQTPQSAREQVASALGLPEKDVTIHVTFLGGGFGRKSKPDYIVEAALISREMKAPVRVQWTREDDLRHGYFHARSHQRLTAGLDGSGRVVAWRQRIASPSIASTFVPGVDRISEGELGQGVLDLALDIPNVQVERSKATAHLRIGWLRSVYNINHAFAVQRFIHELAGLAGRDPRDMLLEVLGPERRLTPEALGVEKVPNYGASLEDHPIDVGRLRRVIRDVTEKAGWDARRGRGESLGLAAHYSFLSYVAVVARVIRGDRGRIKVAEVWVSADPGQIVNRDRVVSQLEGAVIFGMAATLYGRITARGGAVMQSNFHDYPMPRMGDAPAAIHVSLIPSGDAHGGVGEPGVPPVAPAIANAASELLGEPVRRLPMYPVG